MYSAGSRDKVSMKPLFGEFFPIEHSCLALVSRYCMICLLRKCKILFFHQTNLLTLIRIWLPLATAKSTTKAKSPSSSSRIIAMVPLLLPWES